MCGYVEKDGEKYMWIGKRSEMKQTYPGMLDHLVAGGMVAFSFFLIFNRIINNSCLFLYHV